MPTTFQLVQTSQTNNDLCEPVLCSFPQNTPANLSQMNFNIFEQSTEDKSGTKKRLLKSSLKNIKYSATSFNADNRQKSQGSDYYVGIYDSTKDRCYLMPVQAGYQMFQKVDGFQEKYGANKEGGEAIGQLAYYEQKKLLAQSFGTAKAQRKLQSVLTNRVEEVVGDGSTKGIKDQRLQTLAQTVTKETNEMKKANIQTDTKRQQMYGRDALMPTSIFEVIPYKDTFEALKNEDEDRLKELLCGFVVSIAKGVYEQTWETISDKKEKKTLLKALVYLDTLISLYRMPPAFEFCLAELSRRFRGVKEDALEMILQKFCTVGIEERGETMRRKPGTTPATGKTVQYKFMRSKEQTKILMLHIIGIVIHLSPSYSAKLTFLCRILKKEPNELKSYCNELGLKLDPCKTRDRETGKEFDDFLAILRLGKKNAAQ